MPRFTPPPAHGAHGARPVRRVVFYTKHGCHLCERAEELLEDAQADYDLRIASVDIMTDPTIFERYRYEIPVVVVEGGGAVSGRIDMAGLRRALEKGDGGDE